MGEEGKEGNSDDLTISNIYSHPNVQVSRLCGKKFVLKQRCGECQIGADHC
jgi:hypothetical protein